MSVNAIEKAIWLATTSEAEGDAFRADSAGYFDRFRITPDERTMLVSWKLKALIDYGVNPGLLLGAFSAIHGRGRRDEYLRTMKANG